ncbi:MAG: DEAD/DEAH box helicase [Bacteroidetes bacterium]|nr:DEAD/DEAH box helicase [Bacteroidota bacterium]
MLFTDLQLIQPILLALKEEGYSSPTPIQQGAIPHILAQKDLLGCAQTGTGKTAAFAIPILQLLARPKTMASSGHKPIRALILTPTRELAIQIQESFDAYGRHLRLKNTVIFGGVNQHAQVETLKRGVDILVATPGRLLDLCSQGYLRLSDIEIFVLDEADRMLDMGFVNDVKRVLTKLPAKKQTLFFSATMPPEIQLLANSILHKPEKISVTPPSSTADTITQWLFFVEKQNKRALLEHILKNKDIETALVFTRTKHGADKVVKDLHRAGISAEAIHGNKSQNARQRALSNFKNRTTRILVATDIAARGIDVDDLTHVINYELPEVPETYVHRIGRTGRAGANGISFSFCEAEETADLQDIQKLIGKNIPVQDQHPWHTVFTQILSRPAPGQNRQQRPQRNGLPHSKPGNRKPQPVKHGAAREKKSTGRREY